MSARKFLLGLVLAMSAAGCESQDDVALGQLRAELCSSGELDEGVNCCVPGMYLCGNTCIPDGDCCANTDCALPDGSEAACATATCVNHQCVVQNHDGARCGAGDLCTQQCQAGRCVDQAVECADVDCNTSACNPASGRCVRTAVADGSACGGNGCHEAGSCNRGTCEGKIKVDCEAETSVCMKGVCDVTTSSCAADPVDDGALCGGLGAADATCQTGACVGVCTPSSPCMKATLNPLTGRCEETPIEAGASCQGDCVVGGVCNANGVCVGNSMQDGSQCRLDSATIGQCLEGACKVIERESAAEGAKEDSIGGSMVGGGCQAASGSIALGNWLTLLVAGALLRFGRRRPSA